jgi:hypothetical protein
VSDRVTALLCLKDGFGSSSGDCHIPWLCRFGQPASFALPCDPRHRPGAHKRVSLVSVCVPRAVRGPEVRGSNRATIRAIATANVSKVILLFFRDNLTK